MIYGGRDSSAWVPVRQAFDWAHGIATVAAALESETTAATLGKEGVPEFNPMSNIDFLSIPMGRYIQSNLEFGKGLTKPPAIFGVNYFLKDREGRFLNTKTDKAVWLKWMELRTHGDAEAIKTPVGFIPTYEDLRGIFKTLQSKDFTEQSYVQQFSIRTKEFLAKIKRIHDIYRTSVPDAPAELFQALEAEIDRLRDAESKFGETISPERFL
jgi:phosphoenolpyruvate carboxykinase (GTP)